MMFSPSKAVLVVIDVQGKLAYLMHEKDSLFKHIQALIQAARILDMPVLYTEQAPQKIGETIPEIKNYFKNEKPIIKDAFSCAFEPTFVSELKRNMKKQIIVVGIETHVCIFQTVADLLEGGYHVQVVADAVSSRSKENKDIAIERLRKIGAIITSTEMLATELMRTSKHPKFREILSLIR